MKISGLRLKDLWWFSVPSIFSSVFEPLASIVDTALVGNLKLGATSSLASLALGTALFSSITWIFNFLVHASTQNIADFNAAKDDGLLRGRLKISLTTALIVGLACSLALYFPRDFWFSLVGGTEELRPLFDDYFLPRVSFHTFSIVGMTGLSLLRGFGRLRLVLFIMIFGTSTNIFVSWYFMHILNLGIKGAAYGTIISQIFVVLSSLFFIFRDNRVGQKFFSEKVSGQEWLKFGKSSFDLFGRSFTLTSCFFISTRLASQLGVAELGAHQVLLQVWLLASFFLDGLAISGNVLGARFYFAKQMKRTALAFKGLTFLGGYVGLFFTVIYGFFWQSICSLFTNDPAVLLAMNQIKWVIVASQLISAIAFVYDGLIFGLNGFGFLRKHMVIGAVFVYAPLALSSLVYPKLILIWSGLVVLNLYRGLSGHYFVNKRVWSLA